MFLLPIWRLIMILVGGVAGLSLFPKSHTAANSESACNVTVYNEKQVGVIVRAEVV